MRWRRARLESHGSDRAVPSRNAPAPRPDSRPAGRRRLDERTKNDHHALMSSIAHLSHLVASRHLEFDSISLDLDYLGFGTDIMTYGCSGKMPYIYRRTDRALTHIQKWLDSAEGGVFHDQDHHGGRQHLR